MRYKMYALVLASVLAIASTGCQAIKTNSCGSGPNLNSAQNCGCQNCQNGMALGAGAAGYQSGQSGVFNAVGNSGAMCNCQNGMCNLAHSTGANADGFAGNGNGTFGAGGHGGAFGAGGMGAGGGIDLSACPGCLRLGRPCASCLAPGGRLHGIAGGAAGKARGLFSNLINRAAAHDCQTPYTQPFADSGMPGGPMTPTYGYPYYTTRAPRDFLACNPPSIGP